MTATKTSFGSLIGERPAVRRRLAITVLAGGPGGEREVSLESGRVVAEALRSLGHQVYLNDISPGQLAALARQVDCVFVALHGEFGEDGQVQQILEDRGLAYTGSSPETCRLAMDKAAAKERFVKAGVPTPRYAVATPATLAEAVACWSLPAVVKPIREGSSLHCRILRDAAGLRPAVETIIHRYGDCLIEEYIPGLELTVGILGEAALDPLEIRTSREFYDYQAKYIDDTTVYDFDINLPAELLGQVRETSIEAHRLLGCRGFSRVDWRVNPETMQAYVLEVNVIPGLTNHSLLPKAAARIGLSMAGLCQFLINDGLKRRYGDRF